MCSTEAGLPPPEDYLIYTDQGVGSNVLHNPFFFCEPLENAEFVESVSM